MVTLDYEAYQGLEEQAWVKISRALGALSWSDSPAGGLVPDP